LPMQQNRTDIFFISNLPPLQKLYFRKNNLPEKAAI